MSTEGQSEQFLHRWEGFADRVHRELGKCGLISEVDYMLQEPRALHKATVIELKRIGQLTPDVLLACDRAVHEEPDWSAIVAVIGCKNLMPLVQTNGGMFTLIGGGADVNRVIFEAIKKRGDGWLQYVNPPDA